MRKSCRRSEFAMLDSAGILRGASLKTMSSEGYRFEATGSRPLFWEKTASLELGHQLVLATTCIISKTCVRGSQLVGCPRGVSPDEIKKQMRDGFLMLSSPVAISSRALHHSKIFRSPSIHSNIKSSYTPLSCRCYLHLTMTPWDWAWDSTPIPKQPASITRSMSKQTALPFTLMELLK